MIYGETLSNIRPMREEILGTRTLIPFSPAQPHPYLFLLLSTLRQLLQIQPTHMRPMVASTVGVQVATGSRQRWRRRSGRGRGNIAAISVLVGRRGKKSERGGGIHSSSYLCTDHSPTTPVLPPPWSPDRRSASSRGAAVAGRRRTQALHPAPVLGSLVCREVGKRVFGCLMHFLYFGCFTCLCPYVAQTLLFLDVSIDRTQCFIWNRKNVSPIFWWCFMPSLSFSTNISITWFFFVSQCTDQCFTESGRFFCYPPGPRFVVLSDLWSNLIEFWEIVLPQGHAWKVSHDSPYMFITRHDTPQ